MKKVFTIGCMLSMLLGLSAQNNAKQTVNNYFTWLDAGNVEQVGTILADDLVATTPFSPKPFDKIGWRGVGEGFQSSFPGNKHEIKYMVVEKNWVAVRGTFKGKNTGMFMGNPPTNNLVDLSFTTIFSLNTTGKIKKIEVEFDQKLFGEQLMKGVDPDVTKKEIIRSIFAAADKGDVMEFLSYWDPMGKNYFAGKETSMEEMKKRILGFKTGFPDVKRSIQEIHVSGNKVFVRGILSGTNVGSFMGKTPTNKSISIVHLGLYTLNEAGKIIEGWVEFDTAGLDKLLSMEN